MPFFFPYSENFIDLRMRIGSKAGVAGTAIVIESIGEFLVPKSIEEKAEASPQFESMDIDTKARFYLHLMLMAAEDIDSK
jgi:hypothetical protein